MTRIRTRFAALAILGVLSFGACARGDLPSESPLFRELRSGGVILYMRHSLTDPDQKDGPKANFEDCSWQRNLTEKGRAQAKEIGESLSVLKLPIESVIASPMCRAMETARLAFGRATPELDLQRFIRRPDDSIDVSPITKFFTRAPSPGRIVAIVGHEHPALGFQPMLQEGEAVVIRPKANQFEVVGRISPEQWRKWAKTGHS
jgi:phosphohistidine phosphatase SixA